MARSLRSTLGMLVSQRDQRTRTQRTHHHPLRYHYSTYVRAGPKGPGPRYTLGPHVGLNRPDSVRRWQTRTAIDEPLRAVNQRSK